MLRPISEAQPAGSDVSYDPDFERIEAEVRKMESVSDQTADWPAVVEIGSSLLTEKTKDFRVAGYLALGLFHEQGCSGLAEGLTLLAGLVDRYWENGYPALKRLRTRLSVMNWLSEKAARAATRIRPAGPDELASCVEALDVLKARLKEKLGDDAPGLTDLEQALRDLAAGQGSPAPEGGEEARPPRFEEPEGPASPTTTPVRAAAPVASSPARTGDGGLKNLREVQAALKRLASAQRADNPQNPVGYRLARIGAWLAVGSPPPNEHGRTRVPPPPKETVRRFEDLLARQEWPALLEGAESRFGESIFWLDLQRYVARAMAGLGPEYEACRRAVIQETAAFLQRVPELPDLRFSDDQPAAGEQTRAWLETEVISRPRTLPAGPGEAAGDDPTLEAVGQALAEAGRLAGQGKMREAVERLGRLQSQAGSERDRFARRMETARFFQQVRRPDLAYAQLSAMERAIDRHDLESWDPSLCLEIYRMLAEAARQLHRQRPETAGIDQAVDQAFTRLYRLDPAAALDILGE
ncbi:MAG: type VI secretion system protein TssA [Proteobacteria bacterium]|nr:type VI secretion system protein TssA [Pseudomonadota bacterium]